MGTKKYQRQPGRRWYPASLLVCLSQAAFTHQTDEWIQVNCEGDCASLTNIFHHFVISFSAIRLSGVKAVDDGLAVACAKECENVSLLNPDTEFFFHFHSARRMAMIANAEKNHNTYECNISLETKHNKHSSMDIAHSHSLMQPPKHQKNKNKNKEFSNQLLMQSSITLRC